MKCFHRFNLTPGCRFIESCRSNTPSAFTVVTYFCTVCCHGQYARPNLRLLPKMVLCFVSCSVTFIFPTVKAWWFTNNFYFTALECFTVDIPFTKNPRRVQSCLSVGGDLKWQTWSTVWRQTLRAGTTRMWQASIVTLMVGTRIDVSSYAEQRRQLTSEKFSRLTLEIYGRNKNFKAPRKLYTVVKTLRRGENFL